jgi:hypothetical protein
MRRTRAHIAGVAAICGALAALTANAHADSVAANDSNGFARFLFTLDPIAQETTNVSGGVLTIHFDRKVAIDSNTLSHGLDAYVSSIRADADGQTFRLALAQNVTPHTSISANHIAVDLVPATFSGTPPDLPPPPPKATAPDPNTLPPLNVRVGSYTNFSRIVFDWGKPVRYTVGAKAGHLSIRFIGLAKPDYTQFERVAPPWVKHAGWRTDVSTTTLEFETDPESAYHASQDGSKVILDILAPQTDASVAKTATAKLPTGAEVAKAAPSGGVAISAAQKQTIADTAAQVNGTAQDATPAPPQANAADAAAKPAAESVAKVSAAAAAKTAFAGAPASVAPIVPSIAPPPPKISKPQITATQGRDGVTLNFQHTDAVAAFIRANVAWIVVNGGPSVDAVALKAQLADFPASFDANTSNGTSILRIGLKDAEQIAAHGVGGDFAVKIGPHVATPIMPIPLTRSDNDPQHAALAGIVPGGTRALTLPDTVVGDTLIVIPGAPGHGMPLARDYLEFAAIPTAAGLVIRPSGDDLNVAVSAARVSISQPGGLALTPPANPIPTSPAELASRGAGKTFLDFARWSAGQHGYATERALLAKAGTSRPQDVAAARMALAQFYLANNFSAETLGTVRLMQTTDPALQADPKLQVMRAAAETMMGRYREALTDLAGSNLDGDPHAALWRGLANAALDNWHDAAPAFAQAQGVLGLYTPEWRARALLAEGRVRLALGDVEAANRALAQVPKDLPNDLMLESELLRADLLDKTGNTRGADALFEAVKDSGGDALAAQAIFDQTQGDLAAHIVTTQDAIVQLENLRFRWRGDALELKTLRKLGALYFARADWRRGLQTLRIAAQGFPDSDIGREAQDDMRAAFENLFLKGRADKLSPVDALALFYDFIDLTPIGPKGDEMIRKMADRLVAVDLLGPAATLLKYQVNSRLDGVARAQVAGRLAMLDLLNHQPKDALEALRTTRITGVPDDVNHQRMLLEARALAELKVWDQALDVIAVDEAPDTKALRADIYWESGAWEQAGQTAEALLPPSIAAAPAPLSNDNRQLLLRAAVAFSLASDQTALDRLRARADAKSLPPDDAGVFALMTEKADTQSPTVRGTIAAIASTDTLEAFMKDFKSHHPN